MSYSKFIKLPQCEGHIEIDVGDTKGHGELVYLELKIGNGYDDYYVNLTPEQAYQLSHELSVAATLATMNEEEE